MGDLNLQVETLSSEKRSSWSKANEDAKLHFRECLANNLDQVHPEVNLLQCRDLHCKGHRESLESYTLEVLESIETAARATLPSTGGSKIGKKVPIAGWTEFVKPFKVESQFWFSTWISAGKPEYGNIYNNMRHSKNQYKFAVRRLKRAQAKVQNDKFVLSIINGGVNIFREVKKFRGISSTISSHIDDEVGAENIADRFAIIYKQLYNKVEADGKVATNK